MTAKQGLDKLLHGVELAAGDEGDLALARTLGLVRMLQTAGVTYLAEDGLIAFARVVEAVKESRALSGGDKPLTPELDRLLRELETAARCTGDFALARTLELIRILQTAGVTHLAERPLLDLGRTVEAVKAGLAAMEAEP